MDAGTRGSRAPARRASVALALLSVVALPVAVAPAGEYDTVGADERCFEERDDFRDLDGNGCPEPLVQAGEVTMRFVAAGSGRSLRFKVRSLSLVADRAARVGAMCAPACGGAVSRSGRRAEVRISRTFGYGQLVGVRVWRDGHVGRFFGYRLKKQKPRYVACQLRSPNGKPERCHT
jgi:hypothetical protein